MCPLASVGVRRRTARHLLHVVGLCEQGLDGWKTDIGVWLVLVGMVLTWASVVLLSARVCFCCGVRPVFDEPIIQELVPLLFSLTRFSRLLQKTDQPMVPVVDEVGSRLNELTPSYDIDAG